MWGAAVVNIQKSEEVKFYLDRTIDSALQVMRSIVGNPRLSTEEQIAAIQAIADFHGSISLDLQKCIHGPDVNLTLRKNVTQSA